MLNALTFENVHVEIENKPILDGLNFEIKQGEFTLLLGSNGAGKSTLIKAIMGDQKVSQGQIQGGRKGLIAQDPSSSTYGDLTIAENCRLLTNKDCKTHLKRFLPRFIEMMDRPVKCLSGGERQVLALALALIDPPDLLLLDEHTSALDPKTAGRVMALTLEVVQEFKVATLMTTHNLEHANLPGLRILALKGGKIAYDGRKTSKEKLLALCYD